MQHFPCSCHSVEHLFIYLRDITLERCGTQNAINQNPTYATNNKSFSKNIDYRYLLNKYFSSIVVCFPVFNKADDSFFYEFVVHLLCFYNDERIKIIMNVEQLFSNISEQQKLPNSLKEEQFDIIQHINQLYSSKKFDSITNKKKKEKTLMYTHDRYTQRVTTVSNRPNKHYTRPYSWYTFHNILSSMLNLNKNLCTR